MTKRVFSLLGVIFLTACADVDGTTNESIQSTASAATTDTSDQGTQSAAKVGIYAGIVDMSASMQSARQTKATLDSAIAELQTVLSKSGNSLYAPIYSFDDATLKLVFGGYAWLSRAEVQTELLDLTSGRDLINARIAALTLSIGK